MEIPCPKPASLTAIPTQSCKFKFDQVLRIFFQRNTADAPFTSLAPITAKASWDAHTAAADDNKVIKSPVMMAVEIPSSERQEEGGNDNSTPFGMAVLLGGGSVQVTGQFRNLEPAVVKELRKLSYESDSTLGVANLRMFMINKNQQFIHEGQQAGGAAGDAWGIPVYNFFVGSMGSTGFNSDNILPFSFNLQPDWDENLEMTKPTDFNPLTY